MPKISIVIPTLREEGYIEGTVRQFERLKFSHEVIVSDGGSTDRTVELAQAIADKVVVKHDSHPIPARQRNDGAKLARGEFICFTDSSVRIPEIQEFFKRALKKFDEDRYLAAVTGPQNIFPEIETLADKFFLGLQNQLIRFQNNFLGRGAGTGKFMLIRRAAFEYINGFDENLVAAEDLDLYRRLAKIGKTRYCSDLGILYPGRREHGYGWPKLLWIWVSNVIWVWIFGRTWIKDWTPVR